MNATIVARKVTCKGTVQIWTAKASADLIQLATSAVRKVTFSGIAQRMALEMHLVLGATVVANLATLPGTARMTAHLTHCVTDVTNGVTLLANVQAPIRSVTAVGRVAT